MITDVFVGIQNTFSVMVMSVSVLTGIILVACGFIEMHRGASNPNTQSVSRGFVYLLCGTLIFSVPFVIDGIGNPDKEINTGYAQTVVSPEKEVKTVVVKEPVVIKPVKPYQPLIPKSEYKAVPEKPVDYTRLGIVLGSIFGGLTAGVLSIVGLMKLRKKLRIRKYQKVVAGVVDLNNDFITLSSHIETIDSYLNDIKKYRLVASDDTKSLLDSMLNILEHKKQVFNNTVKEIHETQPELKVLGGLA